MIKQFNYKQFGNIDLAVYNSTAKSINTIEDHIKIIFIPKHYGIKIDFQEFLGIMMSTDELQEQQGFVGIATQTPTERSGGGV